MRLHAAASVVARGKGWGVGGEERADRQTDKLTDRQKTVTAASMVEKQSNCAKLRTT